MLALLRFVGGHLQDYRVSISLLDVFGGNESASARDETVFKGNISSLFPHGIISRLMNQPD